MLKTLPNIGEHRGIDSVCEPVSEMIHAAVGIQEITASLGVASAPLHSNS